MYVVNLTIIGSDNGLSPARRQATILTNARVLLMGPLETNLSETLIDICAFHSKKRLWKCRLENGGHSVAASMCWYAFPSMTIGVVLINSTI